MTNGPGKSDRPTVPAKSPNNDGQPAAEGMEGRGLAKGNLPQQNASVHDHLASNDVGCQLCRSSDRQLPIIEMDQPFNRSVNVQVLVARDLAFHMHARTQPRCSSIGWRSRWVHNISIHLGCSFPRRRSELWRLIHLPICWFRVRSVRRFRFLITPRRNLPSDGTAELTNRVGAALFHVSFLVS